MSDLQNLSGLSNQLLDQAVQRYIKKTDFAALQAAADRAGAAFGRTMMPVQFEYPRYSSDVEAAYDAFRFMQQVRPSAKLELQDTVEGVRAQVSFWRNSDKGTLIYGAAQDEHPARAIVIALLAAENKALKLGLGLIDLNKLKKEAVVADPKEPVTELDYVAPDSESLLKPEEEESTQLQRSEDPDEALPSNT